jgi:hypothetical protein
MAAMGLRVQLAPPDATFVAEHGALVARVETAHGRVEALRIGAVGLQISVIVQTVVADLIRLPEQGCHLATRTREDSHCHPNHRNPIHAFTSGTHWQIAFVSVEICFRPSSRRQPMGLARLSCYPDFEESAAVSTSRPPLGTRSPAAHFASTEQSEKYCTSNRSHGSSRHTDSKEPIHE